MSNKYLGKKFSILGDSISTFDRYNPLGYNIFYWFENCARTGVNEVTDTWWDKVITFFGGELLVNNSWSGSRVTKLSGRDRLFPSGCSDERTSFLHSDDKLPDVIIIYLGTNDWAFGVKTRGGEQPSAETESELFENAYNEMLRKVRVNYPNSEVWCCTIGRSCILKKQEFVFPDRLGGTDIEEYNNIIRMAARANRCRLIDLYKCKYYDSIDGIHPTKEGMTAIAEAIIKEMECSKNQA